MIINSNELIEPNIKKAEKHYMRYLNYEIFILLILLFSIIASRKSNLLLLLALCMIAFLFVVIIPYLTAVRKLNNIVKKIEINQPDITFSTIEIYSIKGFLKLKPKKITMKTNEMMIILDNKNIFSKNFRSDVYSFSYKKKKFYIVKDFFDDFKSIAANLQFE